MLRAALARPWDATEACPDLLHAADVRVHADLYKLFLLLCPEESAPVCGSLSEITDRLELALQAVEPREAAGAAPFVSYSQRTAAYIKHLTWDLCFSPTQHHSWCVSSLELSHSERPVAVQMGSILNHATAQMYHKLALSI
jgi:hypothetical protein